MKERTTKLSEEQLLKIMELCYIEGYTSSLNDVATEKLTPTSSGSLLEAATSSFNGSIAKSISSKFPFDN